MRTREEIMSRLVMGPMQAQMEVLLDIRELLDRADTDREAAAEALPPPVCTGSNTLAVHQYLSGATFPDKGLCGICGRNTPAALAPSGCIIATHAYIPIPQERSSVAHSPPDGTPRP